MTTTDQKLDTIVNKARRDNEIIEKHAPTVTGNLWLLSVHPDMATDFPPDQTFSTEREAMARQDRMASLGIPSQLYEYRLVCAPARWQSGKKDGPGGTEGSGVKLGVNSYPTTTVKA
jgi:hypothetical protein